MRCQFKARIQWRSAIKAIVAGTVLVFFGLSFYRGWHEIRGYEWNVRPWLVFFSFVVTLAQSFLGLLAWTMTVRSLGGDLSLRKSIKVYFVSNLGRYLPGTVWYAVGRAYLGKQQNVSAAIISTSVMVEIVLAVTSGVLMSGLALPLILVHYGPYGAYLGGAVVVLGLIALHPAVMKRLLGLLTRLLHCPNQVVSPVGYFSMLGLLIGYVFVWAFAGMGLFVLLNSICVVPLARLPTIIAIYAVSWIVGFFTPFAPSGLGVREGALTLLLAGFAPLPVAAAVALSLRLLMMLGDILWAALGAKL